MRRLALIVIAGTAGVLSAGASHAQTTQPDAIDSSTLEHAYAKLHQRQHEAATQPAVAEDTNTQLRRIVANLQEQVAALQIENAHLRRQLADAGLSPTATAVKVKSHKSHAEIVAELRANGDTASAAELEASCIEGADHEKVTTGMTLPQVEKVVGSKGKVMHIEAGAQVVDWQVPNYIRLIDSNKANSSFGMYTFEAVFEDGKLTSCSCSDTYSGGSVEVMPASGIGPGFH